MSRADNVSAFTAGRIDSRLVWRSASSRRFFWRRFAPYLGIVLALFLFGGALYLLHRQVSAYDPEDVRSALAALSWQRIIAAFGLTAASYVLLVFYDALALRHMRKTLPFGRVALASFTSYAFTHSFGFGSLMHATIRYRLYAPLGLRTVDIAEITAFAAATSSDTHSAAGRPRAALPILLAMLTTWKQGLTMFWHLPSSTAW